MTQYVISFNCDDWPSGAYLGPFGLVHTLSGSHRFDLLADARIAIEASALAWSRTADCPLSEAQSCFRIVPLPIGVTPP